MSNNDRPLSPHLSIYRWPVTMATSILHRATGVGMSIGFILFVFCLGDMAVGPDAYAAFMGVMDSTIGRVLLIGWSWAFFYHLANGVRHLIWDAGYGYDLVVARQAGMAVLAFAAVMTVVTWLVIAIAG